MKKFNVLVTGCGDDIGQSIGKILKSIPFIGKVIGSDITSKTASKFIYDDLITVSPIAAAAYVNEIKKIIDNYKIDIIIPACEPEIRFHTKNKIDKFYLGKIFISADLKSRKIGFDKLETARFLERNDFPFPKTELVKKVIRPEFPVILKSRTGSGSKKIFVINNMKQFITHQENYPNFIAQEFINEKEAEYTCGLFRSKNNEIRSLCFERLLLNGYSNYGKVLNNQTVNELLSDLAKKINLVGSINVQFKISKKGPCIFEINPRFSSTVRFRDLMGFNDLLWSLEDALNMSISEYLEPKEGTTFYKGFEEFVDIL